MKFNILILDDEKLVCNSIRRILNSEENTILTANTYADALEILKKNDIDLLLLDYKLKEIDGLSVLKEVRVAYPELSVIILTAYATVDLAVDAMKLGAFDFIQKEQSPEVIRFAVLRVLDQRRLHKEVEELRLQYHKDITLPEIVAVSAEMQSVLHLAKEFAQTNVTVLISGDTGTGKNLLAKHLHYNSQRFNQPFIEVNCAAIPGELLESELFGYEKGSFTGARRDGKRGLVEQANNGTLLLDEIGELNIDLQTKLLHVLENGEYFRVGGVKPVKIDVRFIACSNARLPDLIETNRFRSDLFYRLNVAHIHIPALRERRMDILPLAKYFVNQFNEVFNKQIQNINEEIESFLLSSPWSGNIRELRNYIERGVLLSKNNQLELKNMICAEDNNGDVTHEDISTFTLQLNPQPEVNLLHAAQNQLIEQALEITAQNKTAAAKILGVPRTTLTHYIKRTRQQD